MALLYGDRIPEAPDIRQQRPGYFNQRQVEFSNQFAMPQGQKPYDVGDPASQLPDLWPEIKQELQGILQQGRQPYYMNPEGGQLTPEQQEHNKMLMAWKSPAGLSAIETGKYRESQEKARDIERAESRVANYGKQLAAAHKAEAPKGLIMQLEKSFNASVKGLDGLLGEGKESGYPRYTGKGKFEIEGMEQGPGLLRQGYEAVKDWVVGDSQGGPGLPRGQESPLGPEEPTEMQPGSPVSAVGDVGAQAGKVFIKGLLSLDKIFADTFGNKKAKALTDEIVASSQDPQERLQKALETLPAKVQQSEEVLQLKRQLVAQQVQSSRFTPPPSPQLPEQAPAGQPGPSMPIFQQFQEGIPGQGKENLPPRQFTRDIPQPGGG